MAVTQLQGELSNKEQQVASLLQHRHDLHDELQQRVPIPEVQQHVAEAEERIRAQARAEYALAEQRAAGELAALTSALTAAQARAETAEAARDERERQMEEMAAAANAEATRAYDREEAQEDEVIRLQGELAAAADHAAGRAQLQQQLEQAQVALDALQGEALCAAQNA